jgi:transposase
VLYLNKPEKIYLYSGIIDFRKQMNGLSQIIELEFSEGSLAKSWFVFISRDKRQVKLLYWRGSGLALWQYRLEEEMFSLPSPRPADNFCITMGKLRCFLEGYNIFEGAPHKQFFFKKFA